MYLENYVSREYQLKNVVSPYLEATAQNIEQTVRLGILHSIRVHQQPLLPKPLIMVSRRNHGQTLAIVNLTGKAIGAARLNQITSRGIPLCHFGAT